MGSNSGLRRWLCVFGVAAAVCVAYFAGRGLGPAAETKARSARVVMYYRDPMHPAYRSDRPGKAPDCGMDLEPVYVDSPSQPAAMPAGGLRLTPDQEQAVRLQTETVEITSTSPSVRTVGRVAPDEGRTYQVSAGVDGWVRRVFTDRTGAPVKRGETLAAIYSKDISAPQQAYLYALESYERLKQQPSTATESLALATQQLTTARDNLEFLGMGAAQLEELGRTRREVLEIHVTAPAAGRILERNVAVGQRFMKGQLLYRIADLDRVWVLADLWRGNELAPEAMTRARVLVEGMPPLEAKLAPVLPQFDEQGRRGKLRLEVNNPRGILVPGMLVDVELEASLRTAITVHADAVMDTGASKRVFVALDAGQYQPRTVETGWQNGDRIEIRSGLKAGERVVTAGAFLLDSESRMKNPATDLTDPECGMKLDRATARRVEWRGVAYYLCSESCERKFNARHGQ